MVDPTVVAVPIVVGMFWLLRSHGLIANLPLWALALLVGSASLLSAVANEAWPADLSGLQTYFRVGTELTGITIIIYAVGWGPTLVVGLVFGVADCMRSVGAATTRPAIVLSVVLVGLGQTGIAIGVVPTLVPQPLVHALAVLAVAGLVFTIQLLGWVFGAKEQSDEALIEAEARFRGSFDGAAIGICLVSTDAKILQANHAFGSTLGYHPDELVGIPIEDLAHSDDRQLGNVWTHRLFSGDVSTLQLEMRYLHADGHAVWVSLSASCIRDSAGIVQYGIGQIEDVTERQRAERVHGPCRHSRPFDKPAQSHASNGSSRNGT